MAPFTMTSLARLALVMSSLAAGSYGHLIMNAPVPFGVETLDNSPLVDAAPGSTGSDFPCKQRAGVYDISAMNNMAVGDTQLLNFTGSASHGGGTCQLAVTMDLQPTIHSVWKIIQVFEGGCPISADGNDGTHPFTFEIPKGFPNGRATLSWTWYNRIGNREIYQNCAPIDVTGGADDKTLYDSLPEWYIINLPSTDCSTPENLDVIIPNPGQYIMKGSGQGNTLASASGASCAASAATQTKGVTGYKTAVIADGAAYSAPAKNGDVTGAAPTGGSTTAAASGAASTPAPSPQSNAANPSQPAATTPAAASSSTFSTMSVGPSSGISGPASGSGSAPPASTGGVSGGDSGSTGSGTSGSSGSTGTSGSTGSTGTSGSTGSTGTSGSSGSTGSSSSTGGTGTCTGSGTLVCNGPSQFGLCNNGSVVWQAVAAGTTCSNGQITRRSTLRDTRRRRRVQQRAKMQRNTRNEEGQQIRELESASAVTGLL